MTIDRRQFIKWGALLGVGATTYPALARLRRRLPRKRAELLDSARNCIFVNLLGAPSHMDTFDLKLATWVPEELGAMELAEVRIEFVEGSNTHYFKYRDFRGNRQRVDGDSGLPLRFYHYDSFGVADVFGTPSDMPEHTFAGGLVVGDGMVLTGRRVLDPACKCYWSDDPVFNSVTQIAYTPNPLELWDPTGAAPSAAIDCSSCGVCVATQF